MSTPTSDLRGHRPERTLAYIVAGVIGLSIIAFIAVIIGYASGVSETGGIWPAVVIFPLIGFPIGIALLIAILIMSAVRRRREIREERS